MSELTQVLQANSSAEGCAPAELLTLVYRELRRQAVSRMAMEPAGQTLQPTALVHEAWLRLFGNGQQARWQNRAHFFGAASEAMRRILIENARKKARVKRGGNLVRFELGEQEPVSPEPEEKILLIDEALERLRERDPALARIVSLKFFGGLTNQEVAESEGVTERTIERQWAYAKAWLFQSIRTQA